MQVWAGYPPGGTDQANYVTLFNSFSLSDQGRTQVAVPGHQPLAMIEKNRFAVLVQIIYQSHFACRRRANLGARGGRNI